MNMPVNKYINVRKTKKNIL